VVLNVLVRGILWKCLEKSPNLFLGLTHTLILRLLLRVGPTYHAFNRAASSECHEAERRAGCRDRGVYSD
jgi:hypothetical protein